MLGIDDITFWRAFGHNISREISRNPTQVAVRSTRTAKISREISRNNVEYSERVTGIFSKMAAPMAEVW